MKPSLRRAMPTGFDKPEMKGAVDANPGKLDFSTLLLVVSTTRMSPVFFCARPWLPPDTIASCDAVCDPPAPNSRFVIPRKIQRPEPVSLLETTKSPFDVMRPHWGCE